MAILTNATFNKLVNSSSKNLKKEVKIDYLFFIGNIYNNKMLPFVFNKYEKEKLFTAKCLLEDEKRFIIEHYNKLSIRKDELKYVFSRGGKYKYHIYDDCETVSNIFVDFIIPEEIRDLGETYVLEFRLWFEQMKFRDKYFEIKEKEENPDYTTNVKILANDRLILHKSIIEEYNKVYPQKYDINPLAYDYLLIREANNTGTTEISNSFSNTKFKIQLSELLERRVRLLKNRDAFREKLAHYDFLLFKSDLKIYEIAIEKFGLKAVQDYGIENFKKFWEKHYEIKKELMSLLFEFFKWTYGFREKNFDEIDLTTLGFECCKLCETRKFNEMSINQKH